MQKRKYFEQLKGMYWEGDRYSGGPTHSTGWIAYDDALKHWFVEYAPDDDPDLVTPRWTPGLGEKINRLLKGRNPGPS